MAITSSLTLADVAADLQDYALDHQEHLVADLFEIGFGGVEGTPIVPLDSYLNFVPTDREIVLTELVSGDPMQPGNRDAYEPKSWAAFKTRKAKPEPCKVDLGFPETKIRNLYNTYMASVRSGKFDPEKLVFEEWLIKRLMQDVQKYLRLAFWTGVSNRAAGTTSEDMFDGFIEQISNFIIDEPGNINTVDLGIKLSELSEDNAVATFEKISDGLPSNMAFGGESVLVVSKEHRDIYVKSYRKVHGHLNYNNEFNKVFLDGTNVEIIVEDGTTEFARPILQPRNNGVVVYDENGEINFDFQKRDRSMAWLMDFNAGVGFCTSERIFVGNWEAEA
ncbi:hypothetical protein LAG90_15715 [Marinilongibacter aquaticus]|uniref:hypothetical protein n=1 Tax=Marinilongibacter aquaticus TaxID=2975157 RepID=UPI0021BD90D3|nr:hypothetical protein [Marinilongibacter aquaticus]UBM58251.1 hypothetical protein LAG90_15715 [Marinilongibacter aquaticus]